MNHRVYVGLGSNIDADRHIALGLDELAATFDLIAISSVYKSDAVGFVGEPFLNLVALITCQVNLAALYDRLRSMEYQYGRTEDCSKFSPRTLDIDILTFDELSGQHAGIDLPRTETTINAFVLAPFAEIAPRLVIPGETETLANLWQRYRDPTQSISRVDFIWQGNPLPLGAAPMDRNDHPLAMTRGA